MAIIPIKNTLNKQMLARGARKELLLLLIKKSVYRFLKKLKIELP
jgi:hypothetical protein